MNQLRLCALIPHYNHSATLPLVVDALTAQKLFCLIIDDGSDDEQKNAIAHLVDNPLVDIIYLAQNGGKGHAMKAGFKHAWQKGYTHALQIDADAQHNLADIDKFITATKQFPQAMICGNPQYGDDVPKSRLHGRKITNFWIIVNTHSRDIKDGMCGLRVYPLSKTLNIINQYTTTNRMEFDTEILVRMQWEKMDFIWIDTPISYVEDGVSHFKMWKDNVLISKMHARLFGIMLLRLLGIKR